MLITSESQYYRRHEYKTIGTMRDGPLNQSYVCDVYGSFEFIPARSGTVSEILSRQCFEHLHMEQGKRALMESARVLKAGGLLRIDIPDPDETIRMYRTTGDEFFIRHLFGPRRDQYGFHTHYTRAMLTKLAHDANFQLLYEEENPHPYPAYTLRFERQ